MAEVEEEVRLLCNKLSTANIEESYSALERMYARDKRAARRALVENLLSSIPLHSESALLNLSALIKLVHATLDQKTSRMLVLSLPHNTPRAAKVYCYIYNLGVIDEAVLGRVIEKRLGEIGRGEGEQAANAIFILMNIFRSCGEGIRRNSPSLIESVRQKVQGLLSPEKPFKLRFLGEALDGILRGRSILRNHTRAEVGAVGDMADKIASRHTAEFVPAVGAEGSQGAAEELASRYGMNTELRKSLFLAVATSGGYAGAQRALYKLRLTKAEFREVFQIIFGCCAKEKRYNPYYRELAVSLVESASKSASALFRKFLAECARKRTSLLEKTGVPELYNLSMLLAELVLRGTLSTRFLFHAGPSKKRNLFYRVFFRELVGSFSKGEGLVRGALPEEAKSFLREGFVDGAFVREELRRYVGAFISHFEAPCSSA